MVRPMDHGVCNIIWDGQLGPLVPEWGCLDKCCLIVLAGGSDKDVLSGRWS